MSIGTVLVIIAGILAIICLFFPYSGDAASPRSRRGVSLILPIALLLVCIALAIGVEPFVRT
jgi:hypothetical protein